MYPTSIEMAGQIWLGAFLTRYAGRSRIRRSGDGKAVALETDAASKA